MSKFPIAIMLLFFCTFIACEKAPEPDLSVNPFVNPNGSGSNPLGAGSFSYKADGQLIQIDSIQALEVVDTTSNTSILSIIGVSSGQALYLWLNIDATVGKHELDEWSSDNYHLDYIQYSALLDAWTARGSNPDPCEVDVLTHDQANRKISGAFYGKIVNIDDTDTISITDGSFDVKYGIVYQ